MAGEAATLARNYLLSLGGEGLQSGFHFILNLVLIRLLAPYDYGMFAIVFILGGISLTYGNALVSVPAMVHMARLKSAAGANFHDVMFGSMALAIAAAIAAIVAAGLWLAGGLAGEAIAGAAFVGAWTLRNHVRSTIFARKAIFAATLSDAAYAGSGIALVAIPLAASPHAPLLAWILAALAVANAAGIAAALKSSRRPIRVAFRRGVRRRYGAIWREIAWSLLAVTAWNIQGQGQMFLIAAVAGPAAYAPIAAGVILFSPLRTAVGALVNVMRPEFAAALAHGRDRRVRLMLFVSFAAIAASWLAFAAAIWLGWGMLDAHIFGAKFAAASMPLIGALAGSAALIFLTYHVPLALLQAAREFKTVAVATALGGVVGLAAVAVLLVVSTVAWSLAGLVAGEAVCWVHLWAAALRLLRRERAMAVARSGLIGGCSGFSR